MAIIDEARPVGLARHPAATIPLLGNRLCLDFTNTLVWRWRKQSSEFLGDYPALVAWSRYAGALDDGIADFGRVGAGPVLPGRGVRLALPRHDAQRQPPLVRGGRLRQSRPGPRA